MRPRPQSAAPALALALCLAALPRPARAVEFTSALGVAGGYRFAGLPRGSGAVFSMALRVDLLLGRSASRTWGLGPYVGARTDGFADFSPTVGLSLLIPVTESFPLVISGGMVMRFDDAGVNSGALQRVWFGARSYNYHGVYTFASGLFVEARQFPDATGTVDVIAGADLDLSILAMPFIALYSVLFQRRQ